MKTSLKQFVLKFLRDESGNISLTGGDAGASSANGASNTVVSSGTAQGQTPTPNSNGNTTNPVSASDDILASLEEEIRNDPSLKVFQNEGKLNVQNLIKSYVNAQKKIGEKGVKIPDKNATEEEWNNFYNMLRPAEKEKYELLNKAEVEGAQLDEKMFTGFKELAHKAGMTTKQAQSVIDWYNKNASDVYKQTTEQTTQNYQKEVNQLKTEWGTGFDNEVKLAQRAVKQFADENTLKYLKDTGLDTNVGLIKLFNKIGKGLLEDKFTGETKGQFGVSKQDAERKISEIYGNKSHPYNDFTHPGHKLAVQEMQDLVQATLS